MPSGWGLSWGGWLDNRRGEWWLLAQLLLIRRPSATRIPTSHLLGADSLGTDVLATAASTDRSADPCSPPYCWPPAPCWRSGPASPASRPVMTTNQSGTGTRPMPTPAVSGGAAGIPGGRDRQRQPAAPDAAAGSGGAARQSATRGTDWLSAIRTTAPTWRAHPPSFPVARPGLAPLIQEAPC